MAAPPITRSERHGSVCLHAVIVYERVVVGGGVSPPDMLPDLLPDLVLWPDLGGGESHTAHREEAHIFQIRT